MQEALSAGADGGKASSSKAVIQPTPSMTVEYPEETPHLNYHGLKVIDKKDGKGRGVYATKPMSRGELIEISPVLLLSKEEYAKPGGAGETALKNYVFSWNRQGCMAIALGLGAFSLLWGKAFLFELTQELTVLSLTGSMFNHSKFPNVLYRTDKTLKVTHYFLARDVQPNEELTIFYGPHVKFSEEEESEEETLDGFEALTCVAEGLASDIKSPDRPPSDLAVRNGGSPTEAEAFHILFKDLPCRKVSNDVSLADLPLTTGKKEWSCYGMSIPNTLTFPIHSRRVGS